MKEICENMLRLMGKFNPDDPHLPESRIAAAELVFRVGDDDGREQARSFLHGLMTQGISAAHRVRAATALAAALVTPAPTPAQKGRDS